MRIRFAFSALLLVPASLLALDWSTHGPKGGAVTQVAFSPAAPRVIYAAGGAGVFRSDDAGDTWRATGGFLNDVAQLAVDPTNADVLVATAGSTIYKSTDGGATWRDVTGPLTYLRPSALFFDPANHSTVYLASRCGPIGFKTGASSVSVADLDSSDPFAGAGVFKSVDGGDTWKGQSDGLFGRYFSVCVEELSLDPETPGHLFASPVYTDGGFSESYDGGKSWTRAAAYAPGLDVADHPSLTLTRFGITSILGFGVFLRSADGGVSWPTLATAGIPDTPYHDLATDPASGRLFLATDRGVFRSGDGGATWIDAGAPPVSTARVVVDRAAGYLFAANALGLVRAPVTLGAWQRLNLDDPSTSVRQVATDPHDPSTVYSLISGAQGRIFGSHDGGGSWQLLLENNYIQYGTIVVDGAGDLYVTGGDGFRRYSPVTQEWTLRANPPTSTIAADPRRGGYLYSFSNYSFAQPFAVSSNGGETWQSLTSPLPSGVTSVVVDPAQPSTVYAGGSGGVVRSSDSGMTWSPVATGDTRLLTIAPSNPSRLYRTGSTTIDLHFQAVGLSRSDDGGISWTLLEVPEKFAGVLAIAPDPVDAQSVWIISGTGKVYRSNDSGATWQDAAMPVPALGLAIAADGSRLHAATQTFGVWDAPIPHARRRAAH
jgi:photosystem II stability/assembly factor-like uncharacterized protein